MKGLRLGSSVVLLVLILASCGGDSKQEARALESPELARLAETMFINHRQGSTIFRAVTLTGAGGDRLVMTGAVDWSGSSGSARVRTDAAGATLAFVAWGGATVAERRPLLDARAEALGGHGGKWFSRPVDRRRRVDQLIAVVMGLATKRPENAVLIQQTVGSAYLREDSLRGRVVDVMRYGTRSVFWVDRLTGELLRFEGNNSRGNLPLVVDLRLVADGPVPAPGPEDVVDTSANPDLALLLEGT